MRLYEGDVKCPRCGNAAKCEIHISIDRLFISCNTCGLRIKSEDKVWRIKTSYIDANIINKDVGPSIEFDDSVEGSVISESYIEEYKDE